MFVRRKGKIHHCYATELLFAKSAPGQNARHVDMIWPLWNLLDFTPEGRGKDWYPKLDYRAATRDVLELKGMIAKPAKTVSVEDMNRAVRRLAGRR